MPLNPREPHRFTPHPIPEAPGHKPGSLAYYRRFNPPILRGRLQYDLTQCTVCGGTEGLPVHFDPSWKPVRPVNRSSP